MDGGIYQHIDNQEDQQREENEALRFPRNDSLTFMIKRKPVSTRPIELTFLNGQDLLHNDSHNRTSGDIILDHEKKSQNGVHAGSRPVWFTTVFGGLVLTLLVLIINISILAWTYGNFKVLNNSATLFTGSCSKTSTITSVAELAINFFSTLLLAVSSNCEQLLISPTRAEVDRAHENGEWVHIGLASAKNFKWIRKERILMCLILVLSSVPLHLLYNSVIYSSSYTSDWLAAAVTEDFLEGAHWNQTTAEYIFNHGADLQDNKNITQNFTEVVSDMQNTTSSLIKLTKDDCRKAYASKGIENPYLNVLLVTNYTSNDSFLDGLLHYPEWGTELVPWFDTESNPTSTRGLDCSRGWVYSNVFNWSVPVCSQGGLVGVSSSNERAFVQYCLAQSSQDFDSQCSISISTTLLLVVIICNSLKATCLLITMLIEFQPLATVGDAVASYMRRPDLTTVSCGPLSLSNVLDIPRKEAEPYGQKIKRWRPAYVWDEGRRGRKRWGYAIGYGVSSIALMWIFVIWLVILVILSVSWNKNIVSSWNHAATDSIFSDDSSTAPAFETKSLIGNVLLINAPQLAVSSIYIIYNSIFTRMLIAHEFSKFGLHRNSLRVSRPTGAQRSTYWLQLPYKYIIPIMICMALIHFFVSRGIYLINVKVYNIHGQENPWRDRYSHATSSLALLSAFLVGTIMLIALCVCSLRFLGKGIPIFGSNSIAISAACHPALGDEDAATQLLQYGVLDAPPTDAVEGRGVLKHVCFSSFEVQPLGDGEKYY